MIKTPEVVIERVAVARGSGEGLFELAMESVRAVGTDGVGAVIAATFSNPDRFPSLAVRVAAAANLPVSVPAFDVQMACSAYPYALYLAGRLAADLGQKVLVVDGDVQMPFVDPADDATNHIFSDACTASVVSVDGDGQSCFDFLSRHDDALSCAAGGPIRMDGFKVFSFVATGVSRFLGDFLAAIPPPDFFVPHQANPYMIRRLADELSLKDKLLTSPEEFKNPGSCSIPLTLACRGEGLSGKRVMLAGFGAGYSAVAALVRLSPHLVARV
ncbi:MAG: hypothetical protein IJ829_07440 [Kiritimatiellae bacterium]|nr:hypothetical protein [Kiritimatiellia bacterium]